MLHLGFAGWYYRVLILILYCWLYNADFILLIAYCWFIIIKLSKCVLSSGAVFVGRQCLCFGERPYTAAKCVCILKLLFDTIFFWCRVCFAVFLGQQMLCFVGETPYWYRTVFVCFVLYHVCLVSCLFRYVWFAVFVGQRMSCFEGETLFCCKICLFVEAFFGTVFVRRLFILASCCLRLCWFDSQCLFRCVFWVNGCYVLRERETLYCCRTVCPLASRTWKQFWWKGQPERKQYWWKKNRDKTILVKRTTGNIFLFHLFGLYQGGVNIAGNNLL